MTAEYPGGTCRSSLPPDMPVRDDIGSKDNIRNNVNKEVGSTDKREREAERVTEDTERGVGGNLKSDDLKRRKRGLHEKAMDPDCR
ncbi:hypothetical protein NDU88_006982 [Pleurodeles waltl]|uniref:Uncharacterized protein n=1 Tax=Pleurodeles waltl TaxID=8319 RepID=A0AAV7UP61_PLEWA|nr:hypothetical protein NDU88_006982 [Pleurodeles waltl]